MSSAETIQSTPENISANLQLLDIFADDQRHHQSSTFNVMLLFLTANGALCAAIELLVKTFGPVPVGVIGLVSVFISFLSAVTPRRLWFRSMRKGHQVQEGLKKMGVTLLADPFGSTPPQGGLRTTHLVHLTVALLWGFYLFVLHPDALLKLLQTVVAGQ